MLTSMKQTCKIKLKLAFLPVVLVIFDQLTKLWARNELASGNSIVLIKKVLSFTYVENRGAVWGLFQGKYNILAIISVVIILGIFYVIYRMPDTKRFLPLYLTLLLIISGAIGNFIDRVAFGFVTDFISFDLIDFPVFNVADIFVTVSAFVMVFLLCFYYKEEEIDFFPFFAEKKKPDTEENNTDSKQ